MSALKNKLAQKVEVINSEIEGTNSSEVNGTSNQLTEQQNNLIVLKSANDSPISSIVPDFAITLNQAKDRIAMLQSFIKEMMVPNVDYGIIPKCDKPSLFKPGAEKLCDIFGFSKQVEILNRVEDWDRGLFHYEVKVKLQNKRNGTLEAEGIGSCNNRERKFKNQDSFSVVNNILKMAKKRALVDAVLSATRSSGVFTQDIEDLDDDKAPFHEINSKQYPNSYASVNNISKQANPTPITKEQQSQIFVIAAKNKIPLEYVKTLMIEKYNVNESKSLTFENAEELIDLLKHYAPI